MSKSFPKFLVQFGSATVNSFCVASEPIDIDWISLWVLLSSALIRELSVRACRSTLALIEIMTWNWSSPRMMLSLSDFYFSFLSPHFATMACRRLFHTEARGCGPARLCWISAAIMIASSANSSSSWLGASLAKFPHGLALVTAGGDLRSGR